MALTTFYLIIIIIMLVITTTIIIINNSITKWRLSASDKNRSCCQFMIAEKFEPTYKM